MYPYNEDVAFERLKDIQREMENNRMLASRTIDVLGLFARPIIALVEMASLTFRPLPPARRLEDLETPSSSRDAA